MLHLEAAAPAAAAHVPAAPAAALTLLDVVAHAPGAAALIVRALTQDERKALRAAHPLLLRAVADEVTKLSVGDEEAALCPRGPSESRVDS